MLISSDKGQEARPSLILPEPGHRPSPFAAGSLEARYGETRREAYPLKKTFSRLAATVFCYHVSIDPRSPKTRQYRL